MITTVPSTQTPVSFDAAELEFGLQLIESVRRLPLPEIVGMRQAQLEALLTHPHMHLSSKTTLNQGLEEIKRLTGEYDAADHARYAAAYNSIAIELKKIKQIGVNP